MPMTLDTLTAHLRVVLGTGWSVEVADDEVIVITPLATRIAVSVLVYGAQDVRWALAPERGDVPVRYVPGSSATVLDAIAEMLRRQCRAHFDVPVLPA
ncbi:hypothetical protein [Streptomyces sp. NPDC101455]|uniref:hypothetical protein n=1 Tax=Streptomyces sp. NPDC101455 TaxID=3366142 RepID=UPI00380689C8